MGCCPTSAFPISKMTSRLGNFICQDSGERNKKARWKEGHGGRKELVGGKENAKVKAGGRRRDRTEVRGGR